MARGTLFFLAAFSVASLSGCSREWYRADADRQVGQLVTERKSEALGYQPDTSTVTPPDPHQAPKKSYERLPLTEKPPIEASPIEPARVGIPYGPLGPEFRTGPQIAPQSDDLAATYIPRRVPKRLQLGPPPPDDETVRLDLFRSLEYAVRHSREYQTQMESLYLSALDVTLERHLFDPRFFANAAYTYNGGQKDLDYQSALTATGQAGVRQKLPYGGEVVASGLVTFVNALNDQTENGESAQLALTGTIPLLRGAGMVNLEGLISSERQLVYTVRAFEEYRRGFAVDVAAAYFRIMTAQQSVVNRRSNYRNLEALLERSQALYEAGRLNFLQVQVSASSLYSAENAVVTAEAALDNAVDDFKLQIGMPIESSVMVMPSALDVTVPDIENRDVIATAHKYRLDLQTRRDQVDDAHRQVEVTANGLLPDLNLVANGTVGNRVDTPASRFDVRSAGYNAGVTLDLPVDRVAERNAYRKSLILLDRARRDLETQKETIAADVLTRIRAIRSDEAAVAIQTRSIELAQRRLEYAVELLKEGKTTDARNVTDAQQTLLSAQDAYEDARANLQIDILRFLRETGQLRVDPKAGALGRALDRLAADPTDRLQDVKTQ